MESELTVESKVQCGVCGGSSAVSMLSGPDRFHLRTDVYQLVRCPTCSLVWLENPPTPQEAQYHYGVEYHQAVQTSGEVDTSKRWCGPRNRVLELSRGGALLDIGCNSGAFLQTMRDDAWKLHGIEISSDQARRAQVNSGARVFVGDVLDAPFAPESFDVVTCLHVMEHMYQPKEVLARVWSWLKPGGILYIQVPNIEGLEASLFGSYWFGLELPRHLYHFSPASLRRLLTQSGYEEILIRTLPDCYIEKSIRYVVDDVFARMGLPRTPLAASSGAVSLPWRIVRKAFRLGVLWPTRRVAAAAGRGPAIEAAFRKGFDPQ